MDVMNTSIILVLRAMGRHSDVRRGEDEHSWAGTMPCRRSDPSFMSPHIDGLVASNRYLSAYAHVLPPAIPRSPRMDASAALRATV